MTSPTVLFMHPNQNILFFDICRLCLDEPGCYVISETDDLSDKILKCTSVKITTTDNLPQKICATCFQTITNTIQLKIKASRNNEYLKTLISEEDEDKKNNVVDSSDKVIEDDDKTSQSEDEVYSKSLSVRKDLFKSSLPEVSSAKSEEIPVKNKKIKIRNRKDGSVVYECTICTKTFDKWKKIYLHLRFHNKTIRCPIDACKKSFATKGDLEKHIRSHTGEKPFICDECDKRFTQKVSLKSHKTTVHKVFF